MRARTSIPLTDQERAGRHFGVALSEVTADMIKQLPPRGTGLQTGQAVAIMETVKSCGCNTIQAVLQKSKYRVGEVEVVYKDPKFDVYSFEYGDGIWGTSIDVLEEGRMEQAIKEFGEQALAEAMDGKEVPVCVPISEITKKYSILNKKGDIVIPADRDLAHMCFAGVVTLPDGREVEPDSPDSPLMKMGLI